MRRIPLTALVGLSAALAVSALSGACIVRARPAVVYVDTEPPPPPPPQQEVVVGVAPSPGWIWVRGHWWWDGRHYEWRGGHCAHPEGHGRWVEPRWERRGNRWFWIEGHWD